ncbi:hypothetical protein AAE478_009634 [Parahypoxylon ruwenzoriense]
MRSRNELNRVDSPSSSGPARPRTRRDSARYAGEPGVELIDLPPYATAPSPQASQLERRSTESTSRRKGLLARLWDEQISIVVDRETSRDHFGMQDSSEWTLARNLEAWGSHFKLFSGWATD